MKIIFITLLSLTLNAQAKLLDKVAGVINDKVFTLSELNQIQKTLPARNEISPLIYPDSKMDLKDILTLLNRSFIIKDKLSAMGFVITDDAVESRIVETEKRLGLGRADLLRFLKSKNISFDEYFEVIRQTMEFNVFNSRIISPLVSISDQELKNFYYKNFAKGKAFSFKYQVLDFIISQKSVLEQDLKRLPNILEEYQRTGTLPEIYKNFETIDLGLVSDEDLPKEFSSVLRETDEGSFSSSVVRDNVIHTFYIKKKDLTESSDYLSKKETIYNQLYYDRAIKITDSWFDRESANYYIQIQL